MDHRTYVGPLAGFKDVEAKIHLDGKDRRWRLNVLRDISIFTYFIFLFFRYQEAFSSLCVSFQLSYFLPHENQDKLSMTFNSDEGYRK